MTEFPEFILQGYMCMNKEIITFLEKPLEFLDSLICAQKVPVINYNMYWLF